MPNISIPWEPIPAAEYAVYTPNLGTDPLAEIAYGSAVYLSDGRILFAYTYDWQTVRVGWAPDRETFLSIDGSLTSSIELFSTSIPPSSEKPLPCCTLAKIDGVIYAVVAAKFPDFAGATEAGTWLLRDTSAANDGTGPWVIHAALDVRSDAAWTDTGTSNHRGDFLVTGEITITPSGNWVTTGSSHFRTTLSGRTENSTSFFVSTDGGLTWAISQVAPNYSTPLADEDDPDSGWTYGIGRTMPRHPDGAYRAHSCGFVKSTSTYGGGNDPEWWLPSPYIQGRPQATYGIDYGRQLGQADAGGLIWESLDDGVTWQHVGFTSYLVDPTLTGASSSAWGPIQDILDDVDVSFAFSDPQNVWLMWGESDTTSATRTFRRLDDATTYPHIVGEDAPSPPFDLGAALFDIERCIVQNLGSAEQPYLVLMNQGQVVWLAQITDEWLREFPRDDYLGMKLNGQARWWVPSLWGGQPTSIAGSQRQRPQITLGTYL